MINKEEFWLFESPQAAEAVSQLGWGCRWDGLNAVVIPRYDDTDDLLDLYSRLFKLRRSGKYGNLPCCPESDTEDILTHRLKLCWQLVNASLKRLSREDRKLDIPIARFKELISHIDRNRDNYLDPYRCQEKGRSPSCLSNVASDGSFAVDTTDREGLKAIIDFLKQETVFTVSKQLNIIVSSAYLGMAICYFETNELDECDREKRHL